MRQTASGDIVIGPGGQGMELVPPAHLGHRPASATPSSQVVPLLTTLTNSIAAPSGIRSISSGLFQPLVAFQHSCRDPHPAYVNGIVSPLAGLVGSSDLIAFASTNLLATLGIKLGHNNHVGHWRALWGSVLVCEVQKDRQMAAAPGLPRHFQTLEQVKEKDETMKALFENIRMINRLVRDEKGLAA